MSNGTGYFTKAAMAHEKAGTGVKHLVPAELPNNGHHCPDGRDGTVVQIERR